MKIEETKLSGVLVLTPRIFTDDRGRFLESWNSERYAEAGINGPFVQDNMSVSKRGVLRGLHFQNPTPQGKLVSVISGAVYDVIVDLRSHSQTYGQWLGVVLSADNGLQMWIPEGFAHGFQALADESTFLYKCTAPYSPADEHSLRWDDPTLAITWPIAEPLVSHKDRRAPSFKDMIRDGQFIA